MIQSKSKEEFYQGSDFLKFEIRDQRTTRTVKLGSVDVSKSDIFTGTGERAEYEFRSPKDLEVDREYIDKVSLAALLMNLLEALPMTSFSFDIISYKVRLGQDANEHFWLCDTDLPRGKTSSSTRDFLKTRNWGN